MHQHGHLTFSLDTDVLGVVTRTKTSPELEASPQARPVEEKEAPAPAHKVGGHKEEKASTSVNEIFAVDALHVPPPILNSKLRVGGSEKRAAQRQDENKSQLQYKSQVSEVQNRSEVQLCTLADPLLTHNKDMGMDRGVKRIKIKPARLEAEFEDKIAATKIQMAGRVVPIVHLGQLTVDQAASQIVGVFKFMCAVCVSCASLCRCEIVM